MYINLEEFLGREPTEDEIKILHEMQRKASQQQQELIARQKNRLSDLLTGNHTRTELETQALVSLADYLALMKAASNPLSQNVANMVQPAVTSTEFDRKRFKGKEIRIALDGYIEKLGLGLAKKTGYANSRLRSRRASLERHVALYQWALKNIPEVKATFEKKKDYPYENLRRVAHEANIYLPELDIALILATTPKEGMIVPHLVKAYNDTCAYLVRTQKRLMKGTTYVVESVSDIKDKIKVSLEKSQITKVPEDQAQPHANWLAHALKKVPDLSRLEPAYQN